MKYEGNLTIATQADAEMYKDVTEVTGDLSNEPSLADLPLTGTNGELPLRGLLKFQIVSLWDMRSFPVFKFFEIAKDLLMCELSFGVSQVSHRDVAEYMLLPLLSKTKDTCKEFTDIQDQIERLQGKFKHPFGLVSMDGIKPDEIRTLLEGLRHRIEDRLGHELFLYLPPNSRNLFETTEPFGAQVASKLSKRSNKELTEAAKCLALRRGTACVMHLMRSMEKLITTYHQSLSLTLPIVRERDWGKLMQAIEPKVNNLPSATTAEALLKEKHQQIVDDLKRVAKVWRNPTMHVRRSYSPVQAKKVYRRVQELMIDIAGII